jgi:uncharacterized protein with FMN-binding domain
VRNGTKAFVSIVSLGLVAAGYQAGQAAEVSNGFSATPATAVGNTSTIPAQSGASATPTSTSTTTSATSQTAVAQPASTPKASSKATSGSAAAPAAPAANQPAPVSTPKATTAAPAAPAAPATNSASTTKTGTAVQYRYGTVQVSVTKANGKITAVNLLQQGATGGRQGAFPYLVDYAVQANGSSFGNLGGATFTTDAFKQSLESALAKF